MRNVFKRIIAVVGCAVMTLAVFAGCETKTISNSAAELFNSAAAKHAELQSFKEDFSCELEMVMESFGETESGAIGFRGTIVGDNKDVREYQFDITQFVEDIELTSKWYVRDGYNYCITNGYKEKYKMDEDEKLFFDLTDVSFLKALVSDDDLSSAVYTETDGGKRIECAVDPSNIKGTPFLKYMLHIAEFGRAEYDENKTTVSDIGLIAIVNDVGYFDSFEIKAKLKIQLDNTYPSENVLEYPDLDLSSAFDVNCDIVLKPVDPGQSFEVAVPDDLDKYEDYQDYYDDDYDYVGDDYDDEDDSRPEETETYTFKGICIDVPKGNVIDDSNNESVVIYTSKYPEVTDSITITAAGATAPDDYTEEKIDKMLRDTVPGYEAIYLFDDNGWFDFPAYDVYYTLSDNDEYGGWLLIIFTDDMTYRLDINNGSIYSFEEICFILESLRQAE
ncbi:MAG: hypothetical protein IJT91_00865 [Clostridia bacterium]|nr:hypothetical protein [Clostridia bacterium]